MVDTGIHKIHLFHTYDLHFYFSTNTKARWWILKSTKQVKCWIRCIYHCTKHQPQKRERGTAESHSVHFNKIKNDWSVPSLAYKYGCTNRTDWQTYWHIALDSELPFHTSLFHGWTQINSKKKIVLLLWDTSNKNFILLK